MRKFLKRLKQEWMALKGHNIHAVLKKLNPLLRGWANYFRSGVSKQTFEAIDHWMFKRCVRYVKFNHPNKSWEWCRLEYFGELNPNRRDRWVFGNKRTTREGGKYYLLKLSWVPIVRHVLVKGAASPDDPKLKEYWIKRQRRQIEHLQPPRVKGLARTQKGMCPQCRTTLFNGEELHVHHLQGRGGSASEKQGNLRLIHLYCHQQLHSAKGGNTEDAKQLA